MTARDPVSVGEPSRFGKKAREEGIGRTLRGSRKERGGEEEGKRDRDATWHRRRVGRTAFACGKVNQVVSSPVWKELLDVSVR